MMLQNVALMAQALELGGFANFAEHEYSWFEALGFRMGHMPAGRYLGAKYIVKGLMAELGRNPPVPYALGLEHDGTVLMGSYCPPYYPDMAAAVRAVIECKYGAQGTFRGGIEQSAWLDPQSVSSAIPDMSSGNHRLLRLHLPSLRPLSGLHAAVSHRAWISSVSPRHGVLPALLSP
jgi:hypothetical protein